MHVHFFKVTDPPQNQKHGLCILALMVVSGEL